MEPTPPAVEAWSPNHWTHQASPQTMKDEDKIKPVFSILENPNLTWSSKDSITRCMEKYKVCYLRKVPKLFSRKDWIFSQIPNSQ